MRIMMAWHICLLTCANVLDVEQIDLNISVSIAQRSVIILMALFILETLRIHLNSRQWNLPINENIGRRG